ncbi:hypothetical protein ACHAPT_004464 [Fusarium lateritium]
MRFSPLLLSLMGSSALTSASPTGQPSQDAPTLAQRAGPSMTVMQCSVRIKSDNGWNFGAFDVQGNLWMTWGGIPAAGTKNGQNFVDVVLKTSNVQFSTNYFMNQFPNFGPAPRASVDYVSQRPSTTTPNSFVSTLDGANVDIAKQQQYFMVSMRTYATGSYEPAAYYLPTDGYFGLTITDGDKGAKNLNGVVWLDSGAATRGGTPGRYVGLVTGTCPPFGNITLPLNVA